MTTGTTSDMLARLKAVLPAGWFPLTPAGQTSTTPVLDGVLTGIASGFSWAYSLIVYALQQVLIGTSSGAWVDLHAQDYLGTSLLRHPSESDASYIARVQPALFPPANTRAALISRLTALTGRPPVVFEPQQPMDCGAYGYGGLGYDVAGGYGALDLPFQAFCTAYRSETSGVPLLAGYSGNESSPAYAALGYGTGLGSYIDISTAFDGATDDDIYATVVAVEPAGFIVWTRIEAPTV